MRRWPENTHIGGKNVKKQNVDYRFLFVRRYLHDHGVSH
jgi:hypothetical protein